MRRCRSARPLLGGSSRPRSHRPHADEDPDQAAWSWRLASPPAATLNQNSTTLGIPTDSVGAEFALDTGYVRLGVCPLGMPSGQTPWLLLLELHGRLISQGGVETMAVIDHFDELADRSPGGGEIAIGTAVDLLALQRFHEAFGHRIVPRAADPAHARLDAGLLEASDVVIAGILDAPIGVVDQAARLDRAPG